VAGTSYESTECQAGSDDTVDRECSTCTVCADSNREEAAACDVDNDTTCGDCSAEFYEDDNGDCVACATCGAGEYESVACQAGSDDTVNRECEACTVCGDANREEATACDATNDAVCGDCSEGFFTESDDGDCMACHDCADDNRDEDAACTTSSDAVCGDCADGYWEMDDGEDGEGGEGARRLAHHEGEDGEGGCMAWTECGDGEHVSVEGTATSDVECEEDEASGSMDGTTTIEGSIDISGMSAEECEAIEEDIEAEAEAAFAGNGDCTVDVTECVDARRRRSLAEGDAVTIHFTAECDDADAAEAFLETLADEDAQAAFIQALLDLCDTCGDLEVTDTSGEIVDDGSTSAAAATAVSVLAALAAAVAVTKAQA